MSQFDDFVSRLLLVSKPSSNNNNNNNNNSSSNHHAPPPRPAPPVVQPQAPLIDPNEFKDEPEYPEEPIARFDEPAPPATEFDFLNLGGGGVKPPVPGPPKIVKVKEPSFDLLGGFDSNFSDPFPDIVGSALNKPTEPIKTSNMGNGLDDIFGSLSQNSAPTIAPSKSSSDLNGLNLNFNNFGSGSGPAPQKPQESAKKDPFADLTSTLHPDWSTGAAPKPSPSPMGTPFSTPSHQFGAQPTSSAGGTPKNNPSTPIHQMKSPNEPHRPDYSRSHFQEPQQAQGGAPKSKSTDIFGDILGSQGYSFGSKTNDGPKTINAMRKVELTQTMDPERLKVMEWVSAMANCPCPMIFNCL